MQLHQKYEKAGLKAVSVSLDEAADKAVANKFLAAQKATFLNLLLDEEAEVWQGKFGVPGPPIVYVFNREGKWTKFVGENAYAGVEKLVAEQLEQK